MVALKDCSRCMVYTPQGKVFGEAAVVHTKDFVSLYFDSATMKDQRLYTTVDFYDDRIGLVRAICELVIHRNPSYPTMPQFWMADCKMKEVKGTLQRQKDIRARVSIDVGFESARHGHFYGIIENISAGGFYVVTGQPLDKNELISFQYAFRTTVRTYQARTVRAQRVGDQKYGYGCVFVGLTDNAESAVREYVFKILKKKDMGKKQEK